MIWLHSRKMYRLIYKQISPKSDYFGYFLRRIWHIVLFLYAAAYYDVKELIRSSLFSPGHDFKKPNFWRVWSQIFLEVFIHFRQDIYHSNRLVTANFWKKNGDDSQGGRGNFTYLLGGQIHFALKLFVWRPIKQFWMLFSLIFLVSFDQQVFLQFYYETIILPKIAKFQVRWNITCIIRKLMKNNI